MPTTTNGLPYPSLADEPNVPQDLQNLAEALDAYVGETPGAWVFQSNAQNVANNSSVAVQFDTTQHLRGGMTLGTNGVIVPRTGWYSVQAAIRWASGTGSRQLRIAQNGATRTLELDAASSGVAFSRTSGAVLYCEEGDEISVVVSQGSGGNLSTQPGLGMPHLCIVWCGA